MSVRFSDRSKAGFQCQKQLHLLSAVMGSRHTVSLRRRIPQVGRRRDAFPILRSKTTESLESVFCWCDAPADQESSGRSGRWTDIAKPGNDIGVSLSTRFSTRLKSGLAMSFLYLISRLRSADLLIRIFSC